MSARFKEFCYVRLTVDDEVGDPQLHDGIHPTNGVGTFNDEKLVPDVAVGKLRRLDEILADSRFVEETFFSEQDRIDRFAALEVLCGGTAEDVGELSVERSVVLGVPWLVESEFVIERFGVVSKIGENEDAPAMERLAVFIDREGGRQRSVIRAVGVERRRDRSDSRDASHS